MNGEISIQTFTELGGVDQQFFYQTTASYMGTAYVDGWYTEDFATLADKTFTPGVGVMADAPDKVTFVYSGQVGLEKKTIPGPLGFSLSGNLRPMEVNIQDIVPENIGDYVNGELSIQTFTSLGGVDQQFFYQTTASYMGTAYVDGWYTEDFATLADKIFAPGEGYMTDSPDAAIVLTYKAIPTK